MAQLPPNKRLKLAARVDARRLRNESFFSAPQLKRGPLDAIGFSLKTFA
jgi:hypothetical protein